MLGLRWDWPDKTQDDKLSFAIPSGRWQGAAVAQIRSHIPGLQDEGNPAQFPESFWTPDQTRLLGKNTTRKQTRPKHKAAPTEQLPDSCKSQHNPSFEQTKRREDLSPGSRNHVCVSRN